MWKELEDAPVNRAKSPSPENRGVLDKEVGLI